MIWGRMLKANVSDPEQQKDMPPGSGSGSAWTDNRGKKPRKYTGSLGKYRNGNIKVRILL